MRVSSRNDPKPESAEVEEKRNIERDLEAIEVAELSRKKDGSWESGRSEAGSQNSRTRKW